MSPVPGGRPPGCRARPSGWRRERWAEAARMAVPVSSAGGGSLTRAAQLLTHVSRYAPDRRNFLRLAGLAVGSAVVPWRGIGSSASAAPGPLFTDVPAAASGITLGARQRDVGRALPARDDAARLRLPRLRRRRLDGPLPRQQRAVRLLHADEAAAQRALPQQPRRHLHRRHREGGRAGRHLRHGRRGRRLRQRRLRRPLGHGIRPLHRSTATTATAPSPTSRRRRGSPRPAGPRARSGSTTTTTASSTCSCAASSSSAPTNNVVVRRQQAWAGATTASRASSSRRAQPALPQQRRRHVHRGRARAPTSSGRWARRSASWRPTSTTTGCSDLFVANDTVQNFLFMNRGKGQWEEIGLPAEVAFSANGQPRSGMGVDAADFDQDGWQDLFVANVDQEMFSLYRNQRGRVVHRRRARQRRRAGDATAVRLGPEVLRLRQRRPDRPAARQRPPGRHDRAVRARR